MADLEARLAALEQRVGELEDLNAIRRLHWAYGYYIDFNRAEDVVQLFAADGSVVFLSGEYRGHAGVRRLYGTWFQNFFTQGVERPGLRLPARPLPDAGHHHGGGRTGEREGPLPRPADGRLPRDAAPTSPRGCRCSSYEAGVYENDYVREDGVWKIKRLDYMMQWQADYEQGWSKTAAHLQPATQTYPDNPLGPDVLLPREPGAPDLAPSPGRAHALCPSALRGSAGPATLSRGVPTPCALPHPASSPLVDPCIPVGRLTVVYRPQAGPAIATSCKQ